MHKWAAVGWVGALALTGCALPQPAAAQISCSVLTENQLLLSFSDNAPAGSITPASLRNFVCSVPGQLGWGTPGAIGSVTPNTGVFTGLNVTGSLFGTGVTNLFAAPPDIGTTTPGYGYFTGLYSTLPAYFGTGSYNYGFAAGVGAGAPVVFGAGGIDTSIGIFLAGKNQGAISLGNSTDGVEFKVLDSGGVAVNYPTAVGSATGNPVVIGAAGSDSTVALSLVSKSTAPVYLGTANGTQVRVTDSGGTAANFVVLEGSTTGNPVHVSIAGSDATASLAINARGTGVVEFLSPIQLPVYATASLPSCISAIAGAMAAVSDATSPTYNGTLTGGGSVKVPVYCNGTNWTTH